MDQDQPAEGNSGHDTADAFGQPQPITNKPAPVPVQSPNGAGRFLQTPASPSAGQGEPAPRSIPVRSMLGVNDIRQSDPPASGTPTSVAGAAALGAVAAWPSVPNDATSDRYSQPGALPAPPALRSAAAPEDTTHLPWEAADSWGDVAYTIHLTANAAAGLSYLLWWVSGIVFWFAEKRNRYIRFHAFQSFLWTIGLTVLSIVGYLLTNLLFNAATTNHQPILDTLGRVLGAIFILTIFGLWLWPMAAAFSGHYLRLPGFFSKYAERYSAPPRDPRQR
jgi:uncharacterized membrane protein